MAYGMGMACRRRRDDGRGVESTRPNREERHTRLGKRFARRRVHRPTAPVSRRRREKPERCNSIRLSKDPCELASVEEIQQLDMSRRPPLDIYPLARRALPISHSCVCDRTTSRFKAMPSIDELFYNLPTLLSTVYIARALCRLRQPIHKTIH